MTIFISYSWKDSSEADKVETRLRAMGVEVVRDVNDVNYKDDLRSFMAGIRNADYSIVLISDDYLKSPNCLFELIELSKEKSFTRKLLPIISDGCKIFSPTDRIKFIHYWKEKCDSLASELAGLPPTKTISILSELRHYENILSNLDSFLAMIAGEKIISMHECIDDNFKTVFDFLNLKDPDVQRELSKILVLRDEEMQDLALEDLDRKFPANPSITFMKGYLNLEYRHNFRKAKYYFEICLNEYKARSVELFNNLGLIYFRLENYDQAIEFYNHGLELNNKSGEIYHNLGLLETKRKNFAMAKDYCYNNLILQHKYILFTL